jgi:multimeric flavodoxin WrbA
MKAVAFNGSPRKGGNTEILLKKVFAELEPEGIKTELIQIGGKALRGCAACMTCVKKQNRRCAIDSDDMVEYAGSRIRGGCEKFFDKRPQKA